MYGILYSSVHSSVARAYPPLHPATPRVDPETCISYPTKPRNHLPVVSNHINRGRLLGDVYELETRSRPDILVIGSALIVVWRDPIPFLTIHYSPMATPAR